MQFPKHKLATKYLSELSGIEIGSSFHNPFGLNTINVDYTDEMTVYKKQEIELCGECSKVDVVADMCTLPFANKSYDFVISSHVLEHTFSPFSALKEWCRVAKKYILVIVPHMERTFDKDKPITHVPELLNRYYGKLEKPESVADDHFSVWNSEAFMEFCQQACSLFKMSIVEWEDPDKKVGNGITILFEIL